MSSAANRHPVAQGGLFTTQKAGFSKETQELLKVMMQESKLTNFQQRQLKQQMQSGGPLPTSCNPTSSKAGSGPKRSSGSGGRKPPRPSREGLRSKETIARLAEEEGEGEGSYRPAPGKFNSTKEKSKLQNVMAFGSDTEPHTRRPCVPEEPAPAAVDRFDEVLYEIEERREFLTEMEALGQGQQYRSKITSEISQKIRELELLDKERCSELQQFDHSV